jgi:diamine N-acetyltransferase
MGGAGALSLYLIKRYEMSIRKSDHQDAEKLAALAIQVWLRTYATEGISSVISRYVLSEFTPEKFSALISEKSCAVFVAEKDKNLTGYATVKVGTLCPVPSSAKIELATLYVQEPFIGTGIGRSLLGHAQQWAKESASSPIWLTANSRNKRAIDFYAKHQYTKIGITHFNLGNEKHENLVRVGPSV